MFAEQSYVGRHCHAKTFEFTARDKISPYLDHPEEPTGTNSKEEWKPIPGFEQTYQVSSLGAIKSLLRVGKGENLTGTILKPAIVNSGYERCNLHKNGKGINILNHRAVAMAFLPNPQGLPYVNHIDGNRRNNHVSNLEWITPAGNVHHANRYGGPGAGRRRKQSLTDAVVADWFGCSVEQRPSHAELAIKHQTSIATLGRILKKHRDTTSTVKGKYQWKLSEEKGKTVGEDYVNREKGVTIKMIAEKHGVSPSLVYLYGKRATLSISNSVSNEHPK